MTKLLIGIVLPLIFLNIILSQYAIVQSQHYEIDKYFKYETKKKIGVQIVLLFLLVISFYVSSYLYWLVFVVSLCLNFILVKKAKAKYTRRIKRYLVIYWICIYLIYILLPFDEIVSFLIINNLMLFNIVKNIF